MKGARRSMKARRGKLAGTQRRGVFSLGKAAALDPSRFYGRTKMNTTMGKPRLGGTSGHGNS